MNMNTNWGEGEQSPRPNCRRRTVRGKFGMQISWQRKELAIREGHFQSHLFSLHSFNVRVGGLFTVGLKFTAK